jgi:ribosome-binding protein aMBF1 (putative translation factor)
MKAYKKLKQQFLKNKEVKKAYIELGPEFDLIKEVIKKRLELGLTQAELAKKLGTKQSAISRLERGNYNPTVVFLRKLALAFDMELQISFLKH